MKKRIKLSPEEMVDMKWYVLAGQCVLVCGISACITLPQYWERIGFVTFFLKYFLLDGMYRIVKQKLLDVQSDVF